MTKSICFGPQIKKSMTVTSKSLSGVVCLRSSNYASITMRSKTFLLKPSVIASSKRTHHSERPGLPTTVERANKVYRVDLHDRNATRVLRKLWKAPAPSIKQRTADSHHRNGYQAR